jgi:DNA-binding MarR family transcriptional regulator
VSAKTKHSHDLERKVWSLMQSFVDANNRRGELHAALGFRLGGGRGKVLFLLRSGPKTLGEIARSENVDAPYATVIVDKLEELGLVERRAHPDDNRRKLVSLTPAGTKAVAVALKILGTPPSGLDEYSDAELESLAALLSRLPGTALAR